MSLFDSPEYMNVIIWIHRQIENGKTEEELRKIRDERDFTTLCKIIDAPPGTYESWFYLIRYVYQKYHEGFDDDTTSPDLSRLPDWEKSGWNHFVKTLDESDSEMIPQLKKDIKNILSELTWGNEKNNIKKGLIIGDTRSGKTLNIMGLINAAFDYKWNIIIWFVGRSTHRMSGLRNRIEKKIDVGETGYRTTIRQFGQTESLPSKYSLDFNKAPNRRFLIYGMKNQKTLDEIQNWLDCAPEIRRTMRILIIDEREIHSAAESLMPPDSTEEQKLSKIIEEANTNKPVISMNYLAYTSACYDIFLKRQYREAVFPIDFYVELTRGDSYISSDDVFPSGNNHAIGKIVNYSTDVDSELISLYADSERKTPETLKDSIAWAICASSVLELWGIKDSCTLLIPVDTNENHVRAVTTAVCNELTDVDLVNRCEKIYLQQTTRYKLDDYIDRFPNNRRKVSDYPNYNKIRDIVSRRINDWLNDDDSSISVCYDTAPVESNYDRYAPSFYSKRINEYRPYDRRNNKTNLNILIAFRNISRGLNIRGLVSTYFAKTPDKTDANVPIGMWSGSKKGFELLQRIWMSSGSRDYYCDLNVLEKDLREYLIENQIRFIEDLPKEFSKRLDKIRFSKTLFISSNDVVVCSQCGKTIIEGEIRYMVQGPEELWKCYDCQYPLSEKIKDSRKKSHVMAQKVIPLLLDAPYVPTETLEKESGLVIQTLTKELFSLHYVLLPLKTYTQKYSSETANHYELIYCPLIIEFFKKLKKNRIDGLDALFQKYRESWRWVLYHASIEYKKNYGKELIPPDDNIFRRSKDDRREFEKYCQMILNNGIEEFTNDRFRFHYAKQYGWIKEELDQKNRSIVLHDAVTSILEKCQNVELIGQGILEFKGRQYQYQVHTQHDVDKGVIRKDGVLNIYVTPKSIIIVDSKDNSEMMTFFNESNIEIKTTIKLLCRLVEKGF